MSRIDYTSTQSIEVTTPNGYREAEIAIGLECTFSGYSGSFDPYTGWEEPSGPEFDIVSLTLIDEGGNSVVIDSYIVMQAIFRAFLGDEIYDAMIEDAVVDASENYNGGSHD